MDVIVLSVTRMDQNLIFSPPGCGSTHSPRRQLRWCSRTSKSRLWYLLKLKHWIISLPVCSFINTISLQIMFNVKFFYFTRSPPSSLPLRPSPCPPIPATCSNVLSWLNWISSSPAAKSVLSPVWLSLRLTCGSCPRWATCVLVHLNEFQKYENLSCRT